MDLRGLGFELTDLRYFYHVATSRSFAEGARRSFVSAPAVSKAIKKLEEELGTTLLHRTTRRVTVTEPGELLLSHCRRLFEELGSLVDELAAGEGCVRGPLRVGSTEPFVAYALPRALAQLISEHPEVTPRTFNMSPAQMEEQLLRGAIDVGLAVGRERPHEHLSSHLLAESPTSLVCGPGHPLFDAGELDPDDLINHPFVVPRFFGREYLPAGDHFPEDRYPRRIGATVELMQLAIQMVMEGAFLGVFPNVAIRCQLNHGELRALRGLELGPPVQLRALLRKKGKPKRAVALLLERLERTIVEALRLECAA